MQRFILLIFIFILEGKKCIVAHRLLNDDYCDDLDNGGLDENGTSACSGFQSWRSRSFECSGSTHMKIFLPSSKVHDGICDCCDGEDERVEGGSWRLGVECPNICKSELARARQDALKVYSVVQKGREARMGMKHLLGHQVQQKEIALREMQRDLSYLKKALVDLRALYTEEHSREVESHFKLLRNKMHLCALGFQHECHLWGDPDPPSLEWSLSKWETKTRVSNSTWNGLSVRDKIRTSRCYYEVMRDETQKNHTTVGAYVAFMKSEGGKTLRKRRWSTSKVRRRGLLGPYLENGEEGHLRFKITLCEILGFAALPITLTVRFFQTLMDWGLHSLLHLAKRCVEEPDVCQPLLLFASRRWVKSVSKDSGFPRALDYESNARIMNVIAQAQPYLATPRWVLRIISTAPQLYYGYYFDKSKWERLPQRRQACLCREGMRVITSELPALQDRISIWDKSIQERIVTPTKDYGTDRLWALMEDTEIRAHIGQRIYKFTFFKDIWQDDILIGTYMNWGSTLKRTQIRGERHKELSTLAWVKEVTFGFVIDIAHGLSNWCDKVGFDIKDMRESASWLIQNFTPTVGRENIENEYTNQFYGGGDLCFNGPRRSAVVSYKCAANNVIENVIEIETCSYLVVIGTPLACTPTAERKARMRLTELDVYGYSRMQEHDRETATKDHAEI